MQQNSLESKVAPFQRKSFFYGWCWQPMACRLDLVHGGLIRHWGIGDTKLCCAVWPLHNVTLYLYVVMKRNRLVLVTFLLGLEL